MDKQESTDQSKPNFLLVMLSTMAAAFGVQSNKNRERDFKHGNIWVFIAAGVIFTALFVLTVFTVVSAVLSGQ